MSEQPILIVEDDVALSGALAETLRLAGHTVELATDGSQALKILSRAPVQAVVSDYQMAPMDGNELLKAVRRQHPHLPVLMMTAHGTIQHAVEAMLEGATDYLVKPFSARELTQKLDQLVSAPNHGDDIVARDPATLRLLELTKKVASRSISVLISGESGTGKEVIANYIHAQSQRHDGPFVAINCAAIPENMLEATLFGHEKGSFTGAHEARVGKFEQAQGGTLLLDEISEMDLSLQAKLLRVLQEKEVERIGGKSSIPLDVRIIATTNRDLESQVAAGRFREDLYYRLSVFPVDLPPLRERTQDIEPLCRHFAQLAAADQPPVRFDEDALSALARYGWPGNVRELQNVVQRATVMCRAGVIRLHDLHLDLDAVPSSASNAQNIPTPDSPGDLHENLQSVEDRLVLDALTRGGGSRKRAAELLGISPRTLRYKIARLRDAGIAVPGRGGSIAPASGFQEVSSS